MYPGRKSNAAACPFAPPAFREGHRLSDDHLDLRAGRNLILRQLRDKWALLTVAFGAGLSWGLLRLVAPLLTGYAIDHAIVKQDHGLLVRLVIALAVVVAFQATFARLAPLLGNANELPRRSRPPHGALRPR